MEPFADACEPAWSHVRDAWAALEFGKSFRWRFCQRQMARAGKQRRASRKPGTQRHESASPLRRGRLLIMLTLTPIESMRASGLGPQAAEASVLNCRPQV